MQEREEREFEDARAVRDFSPVLSEVLLGGGKALSESDEGKVIISEWRHYPEHSTHLIYEGTKCACSVRLMSSWRESV